MTDDMWDQKCSSCDRLTEPGRTWCPYHLAKHAKRVKTRKQARNAAGLCWRCPNPMAMAGLCDKCHEAHRSNYKRWAAEHRG